MEEWQIAKINENLGYLISNTHCSVEVKAELKARRLITDEEDENLTAIGRTEGRISEAKLLYELLKKRSDGYSGLLEVLAVTRQSGALKFLNLDDPEIKTSVLISMASEFMTMKVQFLDREREIQDAFPRLTEDDIVELLKNADARKEFELWKRKKLTLELDAVLPQLNPLYIPRLISNRIDLDPTVFKLHCADIFVFMGISRDELMELVSPHIIMSSSDQLSYISCRHIILDDKEDWEDLIVVADGPVHLISAETRQKKKYSFVLLKSTKITSELRASISNDADRTSAFYISEMDFVNKLQDSTENNGACICDVPGMGKSWLLQSLAINMKVACPKDFVFLVSMSSLSEYLDKQELNYVHQHVHLSILEHACESKLSGFLLNHHLSQSEVRIFMFLDGYDEIRDSCLEKVNIYLRCVYKSRSKQRTTMITSSRPHMRQNLEEMFGIIAFDILPFDRAQQVQAMSNQWKLNHPDCNYDKLNQYARHCVRVTKKIKQNDDPDILGNALKCYLLAIACEKRAAQFSKPDRTKEIKLVQDAVTSSLYGLYKEFMDAAFQKGKSNLDMHSQEQSEKWEENLQHFYTSEALKLLFPRVSKEYLKVMSVSENVSISTVCKLGILSSNGSQYSFLHRSFAEYFAGQFFADLWNNASAQYETISERSLQLFFKEVPIMNIERIESFPTFKKYGFTERGYQNVNALEFINKTVLWFMNSSIRMNRNIIHDKQKMSIDSATSGNPLEYLESDLYLFISCCIRNRLTEVLKFITEIMNKSISNKHLPKIFNCTSAMEVFPEMAAEISRNPDQALLCLLFVQLANNGSLETAYTAFNLINELQPNFISQTWHGYGPDFQRRIILVLLGEVQSNENLISFLSFLNDTNTIQTCDMASLKFNLDVEFIEAVTRRFKRTAEVKYKPRRLKHANYQWTEVKLIAFYCGVDLRNISTQSRTNVVLQALDKYDDIEMVMFLLILFGKQGKSCDILTLLTNTATTLEAGYEERLKADDILDAINLSEARQTFSGIWFDRISGWFENCEGVTILKVLLSIWPDMQNHNHWRYDYLHWAVKNGNVDWVRYLLDNGHDVNGVSIDSTRPIHLLSPKCPFEITCLLLSYGADVHAVTTHKRNLVHCYYGKCYNTINCKLKLTEWSYFMMTCGYEELWRMKNFWGTTPIHLLERKFINDTELVNEIRSRSKVTWKNVTYRLMRSFHQKQQLLGRF